MSKAWTQLDGEAYRVVEKPTHTVIYKRFGAGPFRDNIVWDSRHQPLTVGSVYARVLAAAGAH